MQSRHYRNDMTLLSKLKRLMVKVSGGIKYQWTRWGLTYLKNTKAWSLVGWVPSEWLPEPNAHLTLILAVSPPIGVVYYEIHQGPVTASIYLGFMQQLLEVAKRNCNFYIEGTFNRIPVVYDNARIHHSFKLNKVRENEDNAKHFAFESLPPYSPFLNIVEEVNRDIKVGVWRTRCQEGQLTIQ